MAKVTVTFDAYGNMSSDATGFVGKACEVATDKLLAGLADKKAETKKPEYYQHQSSGVTQADHVSSRW